MTQESIDPQVQAQSIERHTLVEDVQALVAGTLLVSLGVALVGQAGLITGGIAGLCLLLHYSTGVGFGKLFFIISLPFYFFAFKKLGWQFTLKTFAAVMLLSLFSELLPLALRLQSVEPLYAATMGGLLMGVGLLVLFRHRASLGGFNILAVFLQERFGWRAGLVQLGLDLVILIASLSLIPLSAAATSLIGAVVLNLTLAVNHRPGRYLAI
ncbi:MAG: hypothetical protein A3I66_01145 [Burkholderiales bacterium RIFCSPLOWO2_02_FULL_57_36]|nr:MAG: hypothetical protein A3I66_01145 [Burkholderiales bacterium RIFCSPLOWO2_02_FULL_57_36]